MSIDQHTQLYGVVGYPIGHSLSPTMQNTAFSSSRLNAIYLAFETRDVDALCEKLKVFITRTFTEEERREQINKIADKYNWEKIASKTLEVYKKAVRV